MQGRLASLWCIATAAATWPPAENPKMPMRSFARCHSPARERTRLTARNPSATASGMMVLLRVANSAESRSPASPVRITRYFKTKAVTPNEFSQRTRIVPSLSNESQRKPPPGQRMTAVPLASEAAGRKTVSVGRATLLMRRVESGGWRVSLSR